MRMPRRFATRVSSFSGGHVLAVAAGDPRIAAVISQAPYTDSIPTLKLVPLRNMIRFAVDGVRDQVGAWPGGEPGAVAAMTAPEALPGFKAVGVAAQRSGYAK